MATISKLWAALVWILGGAASWSTLSGTTETFTSGVDMVTNGYEGAHVTPEVDFNGSPTDDVEVALYGSLDGTNWDDTPVSRRMISKNTAPHQTSFPVRDLAYWRLGFKQTGSTDSHDVRAAYRPWRWQSG